VKYLHAPIERIHNEHAVVVVDEQTCGQLKLAEVYSSFSEKIQQAALAIENLHQSRKPIDDVQVIF
jgi:hypothetical protein